MHGSGWNMLTVAVIKNILLSLLGVALVWIFAVSLPSWIAASPYAPFSLRMGTLRFVGWIPIALGAFVFLWCYGIFIFIGHGTPWPFDPPRQLVITGPYRYVRNPIEGSFLLVVFGEMLLLESSGLIAYWVFAITLLHVRQVFVEEPELRRRFGQSYEEYRQSVPRWIPRTKVY
jgi:protein-S-isoprenylcysteine O-methyltransferase Ste14